MKVEKVVNWQDNKELKENRCFRLPEEILYEVYRNIYQMLPKFISLPNNLAKFQENPTRNFNFLLKLN